MLTMNKRSAVMMSGVLLWLIACQSCKTETQGQSGGHTNWLTCATMSECAGRPEATTCSADGYCLDEKGNRVEVGSVGTGGAEVKAAIDAGRASQVGTDAGAGGGGSARATGDASGTDAGTDAGAAFCSEFNQPAPQSTPVSVRFFNATANNIFLGEPLGSCLSGPSFTVEKDGESLGTQPTSGCGVTCAALRSATCTCEPGCSVPSPVLIAPGKFYRIDWGGTVFVPKSFPKACRPLSDYCQYLTTCAMEEALVGLTLKAVASAQITCGAGAPCSLCTPDATGTCRIAGLEGQPMLTGTTFTGSALWAGEGVIQIDLK
jgi:hypothetical protein